MAQSLTAGDLIEIVAAWMAGQPTPRPIAYRSFLYRHGSILTTVVSTITGAITIGEYYFVATHVQTRATTAQDWLWQMILEPSGWQPFSARIPIINLGTTEPWKLPYPVAMSPRTAVTSDAENLGTGTDSLRVVLHGFEIDRLPNGAPTWQ